jgi:hypothetical protein
VTVSENSNGIVTLFPACENWQTSNFDKVPFAYSDSMSIKVA